MEEIKYLPKGKNSRFDYLKVIGIIILILFLFHYLHPFFKSNHHNHFEKFEIVLGIILITYISFETITVEVKFNFEKRKLEISYLTILSSNNIIEIPFENLSFELIKKRSRRGPYWNLEIYDNENMKYQITTSHMDYFSIETLEKIANQDFNEKDNR